MFPVQYRLTSAEPQVATISFKEEAVDVMEDAGFVNLVVMRRGALGQTVGCSFESQDISATAGKDYEAVNGQLSFEPFAYLLHRI